MIHNVPIVFGQEKASTPDISNLDSKFYLHGMKSLRGWGTTHPWRNHHDYQEICNHGGGGFLHWREGGFPYWPVGIITEVLLSLWPQPRNYSRSTVQLDRTNSN